MSDGLTVKLDTAPVQKLLDVMADYQTLTGKDASQALRKAAREVDFALYQDFRTQPPRPVKGSIIDAARGRSWRMNTESDSYKTGLASALKMLGGAKSGYFTVSNLGGKITAEPVMLGTSGRILARGSRNRNGAKLARLGFQAPAGAVRLNARALAVIRALNLREKAGAGGYMSIQFLTFKKIFQGGASVSATFTAKDHKTTGRVAGDNNKITISGNVPNTATIAQREEILNKAFSHGADAYRADMYQYAIKRAKETISKLSRR